MAESFYFWQTISKRPNWDDLAFKKSNGNHGTFLILSKQAKPNF